MTSEEAVALTRAHVESQFPKVCGKCGAVFADLREFLLKTRHLGDPISYDEELGDREPKKPYGIFSFANCACGTTVVVTSQGMSLATMWSLMAWAREEAGRRGQTWRQVVAWVREEIDKQVLAEPPAS